MEPPIPTLETYEDSLQKTSGLVAACRTGDAEKLKTVLKKHSIDSDQLLNLKPSYPDGSTPLHVACNHGNVDCIKLLLESGADANVYDARGFTAIHCAACNNHSSAIEALLNYSPQDSHITPPCTVDQRSELQETPLHIACLMGSFEAVRILLQKNAELELEDGEENNFLHFISASDDEQLWGWAIEAINNDSSLAHLVDKKNLHGQTPAHRAASLGNITSISALFTLKAKFELTDRDNCSAIDILHKYGNTRCFSIASGQQPPRSIPSSPMPSRAELFPPIRSLSGGSSSSPKPLTRRPSITGRKRPATVEISLPPSSSSTQAMHLRRNSTRSGSIHTRSSSMDDTLNLEMSREDLNKLSRLNSTATASEETIQMVLDNSAYKPPLDLNVVEPVLQDCITPTNSTLYCKEHAIKFTTNYFNSKTKSKPPAKPGPPVTETEIPVCLAAAMHLNISFPSDYTIISPVCFVSCRCEHTCRATLELPHAASISNEKERSLFSVLSFVTFNLKKSVVESPSPVLERRLEPLVLKSLDVESKLVRFKTIIENPCLYAVGIKNSTDPVPRPLVPLRCAVFCLYKKYEEHMPTSVSSIPIKIFVGLNLKTVIEIMESEARRSDCDIHDLPFKLSGDGVQLKSHLDNSEEHWMLDTPHPQMLNYSQIALTEDSTGSLSYSHSLSYPLYKQVKVFPVMVVVSTPVRFQLSVMDTASNLIEKTSFVPFAPFKSTTATPNSSPPPSHSHRRFLTPDLSGPPSLTVTSSSPPPPRSAANGAMVPHHTATPNSAVGIDRTETDTAHGNGTLTIASDTTATEVPSTQSNGTVPTAPSIAATVVSDHTATQSTHSNGTVSTAPPTTPPTATTVVSEHTARPAVTTDLNHTPSSLPGSTTNHKATSTDPTALSSKTKVVNGISLEVSMV